MRKLIAYVAAVFMFVATLLAPTPAEASPLCEVAQQCGDFRHYSPDDGFDDDIWVTCDWNNKTAKAQWVAEGRDATCHDTDGFFVATNRIVSCKAEGTPYWMPYRGPQWVQIHDDENEKCVHQKV